MPEIYYVEVDSNGSPFHFVTSGNPPPGAIPGPVGVSTANVLARGFGWNGSDWVEFGPRPTDYHYLDASGPGWVGNIEAARSARRTEVDSMRVARNQLPITYDGKVLDGDTTAQLNLANKITEMQSRLAIGATTPTALLVWRDAGNVTHTWTTAVAYLEWLQGFAVALSERGTMIYQAAWEHKRAIDEDRHTVADVLAYDITTGWPA